MVQMIDCSTKLTQQTASQLKSLGVTHVGRYLSKNVKGITATEAAIIKAAGLNIVSIYENGSTDISHFTVSQAGKDLIDAYNLAKSVGQPEGQGFGVFFTADYDVPPSDFPAILAYFQTIKKQLTSYKTGAYGSYAILKYLHDHNAVDYYWQTYAWSGGVQGDFINLYQYKNDTTLASVSVDYNELVKDDVGAWGQPKMVVNSMLGTVTVTTNTVLRDGSSGSANIVRTLKVGETYNCYATNSNWFNVGGGFIYCGCASFKPA